MFNKTIQLLIFDGNPNGRIMCELSNWNGRVYKISRGEINLFANRQDANHTGIYFLFGKNESNRDTVYIGEAEKIAVRLKQHLNDSFYWNDCVAIISKDNLLNKAHIKYLENKFYNAAVEAGRFEIVNNSIPTLSSVSEYDEAMLEEFMSDAKMLVNTLGYKVFEPISISDKTAEKNIEMFFIKTARGADASGYSVPDGFVVKKGSAVASSTVESMPSNLVKYRDGLYADGTITSLHTFSKDCIFTSPSYAAAIVMGRSANGRTEWKTKEGMTFKQVEEKNNN